MHGGGGGEVKAIHSTAKVIAVAVTARPHRCMAIGVHNRWRPLRGGRFRESGKDIERKTSVDNI